MRKLISLLVFLLALNGFGQENPEIKIDLACETCHIGNDWESDIGKNFNHITTGFDLKGTHADLNCSSCHTGSNLTEKHNFESVSADCIGCHVDIHNDQWGQDCERCHNPDSWALSTQQQNHDLTSFPLRGPHKSLNCESCHVVNPGGAGSLPLDCWGCHNSAYNESTNPAHRILALDKNCESCHAAQSSNWTQSFFNHATTHFALLGMHAQVECSSCHTQAANNTPTSCESCHQADYNNSIDPAHLVEGYPFDCRECHDSFTWNSSFVHDETDFQLQGAHTESNCSQCHVNQQFAGTPDQCSVCHLTTWQASENPPHKDAGFDQACEACHTEVDWTPSSWNHDIDSEYPLTGAHIEKSCILCHQTIPYSEQSTECYICHQSDYEETDEPNHLTGNIPTACEICHTTVDWKSQEIDHSLTQFPLAGIHAEADCETCHAVGYDLPLTCDGCHLDEYQSTSASSAPNHEQYGFSVDCLVCHGQLSWKPSNFDHDPDITHFEIQGAHLNLLPSDCSTCHVGEQWSGLSQDCGTCHGSNFNTTTDPDHAAQGFPENLCELCHSQSVWDPSIFTHESTAIACQTCHLIQYSGATNPNHATEGYSENLCESCHSFSAWRPSIFAHETTSIDCQTCHMVQYNGTTDPNHTTEGYSETLCESCHSPSTWEPSIFAHETTGIDCQTCHMVQYNETSDPDHGELAFPTNCASCHTPTEWKPSTYVHDMASTGFEKDGAHDILSCSSCHENWDPPGEVRTCASASCHIDNYQATSNPPHEEFSIPTDCAACHTTSEWIPSSFSHDLETTGFQIDGSHDGISCTSCHDNWDPPSEIRSCASTSCHIDNYQATTNPPHEEFSIPTDCAACHSTSEWVPSSFNHDTESTGFEKDGAHDAISCTSCHDNWDPPSEIRSCASASCHIDNYQATTNPPHETMSFTQTCTDCHSTTAWLPSQFIHDVLSTGFFLEGAHTSVDCQQCHSPWQIVPAPRTCAASSCHLADYQGAPDHESASFPLNCESCHSMEAWEPATFDHDGQFFPIYSGQHRGEWNDCSECHINANDYEEFTCYGSNCHGGIASLNSHHFDDGQYVSCNGNTYNPATVTPTDCLTCHPSGDEDDCDSRFLNFFELKILPKPTTAKPHEVD